MAEPILEVRDITKLFGSVIALNKVSTKVHRGEVTCLLGDNGAGKSTLIKILSGVFQPTEGTYHFNGESVTFRSPREARAMGIATVYQELSLLPLMPIWRNFFLGAEPEKGSALLRRFDIKFAKRTVREELQKMGIEIRDPDQPVGSMSGRRTSIHCHLKSGLFRGQGIDPGRANGRPGSETGRYGPAIRCPGKSTGFGSDFHFA